MPVSLAVMSLSMLSCSDDESVNELIFVGDSHVERWDLPYCFPSHICQNRGMSGSGIEYVAKHTSKTQGKDVVVVTGRNDLGRVKVEDMRSYVESYVHTLTSLSARHLYVYCIFPCSLDAIIDTLNKSKVELLNQMIREELSERCPNAQYIDVYEILLLDGELNPEYSADGLHLNGQGYRVLSSKLLECL